MFCSMICGSSHTDSTKKSLNPILSTTISLIICRRSHVELVASNTWKERIKTNKYEEILTSYTILLCNGQHEACLKLNNILTIHTLNNMAQVVILMRYFGGPILTHPGRYALTEVLHSRPQSLWANAQTAPPLGHHCFLWNPSQLIIHLSSYHTTIPALMLCVCVSYKANKQTYKQLSM